ncbi:MAG: TIGR04076 family protein [Planctomycetota bacterium]
MARVRITVVKRLDGEAILADAEPGCTSAGPPMCPLFEEGQSFVADYTAMPEGFCAGAWADLFRFVLALGSGADSPWVRERGRVLVSCNDGFRPVIFRLERMKGAADEPEAH